jgi:hypothetical protein
MANNLMRIRRSTTAATPGTVLANGELAYSYNSNSMFIGAQTGPGVAGIRIAGNKFAHVHDSTPGTLGANVVIITEANSFVSNLFSVGLFVGDSRSNPVTNSSHAHITRISPEVSASGGTSLGGLAGSTGSNAELVTSYAIKQYVDQKVAGGGSFSNGLSYIWSASQQFNENVYIDTATLSVGNTTSNVSANTTHLVVGNATVNSTHTAVLLNFGSGTTANLQTNSTAIFIANASGNNTITPTGLTVNAGTTTGQGSVNTTAFRVGNATVNSTHTATNIFVGNATSNVNVTAENLTINAGSTIGRLLVNATAIAIGNATVNTTITSTVINIASITATANITIASQITANSTLVNFGTVGNVHAASANATFQNMIISGNLTVSGTTTSIDTTNLNVKDNIIVAANGNQVVATDVVDFGFVGIANSGTAATNTHYGFARLASANLIQFFATNTTPGSTISGQTTMPIQAFLRPYGTGAGSDVFVVNSTAVRIAANASVSATLIANTLSLTTALPIGSGGTGQSTYAAGDLLVGGAGSLSRYAIVATEGLVLQVNASSLPQWDTLDGGTF